MSVAFHPTHPAIIIGGTFSGELLAWNLGNPGVCICVYVSLNPNP